MAPVNSGRIVTGGGNNSRFYLSWSLQSQSVEANTSTISWVVGWESTSGSPQWYSNAIRIDAGNIAGQSIATGTWSNQGGAGEHQLRSGTVTVSHNNEGGGSFSASLTGWLYGNGQFSASGSWDLPTIPRASSASLSASSVAIGGSVTCSITRASSSFTHSIAWSLNGTQIGSHTGVATSQAFTIPTSAAAALPNATSGTGTVTVTTMNGSATVGTTTLTFTITIPDTATYQPSFTATLSRVDNTVPTAWALAVQGHSKWKVDISSAAAGSGATLKTWSASDGTYQTTATLTGATATYTSQGVITNSGTLTVTVTLTDSRGRTKTTTAQLTVAPWSPPTVTQDAIYRANSGGTATFDGAYASIRASYTYAAVSSKNSATTLVEYKAASASAWTGAGTLASGSRITIGGGNISPTSSYLVRLTITDALGGTATCQWSLGTAQVDMDFRADANGMGIGGVGETLGALDVHWPLHARKGIRPIVLGSVEDLNDLKGYGTPVWYEQKTSANTSLNRNYPVALAGMLQVVSATTCTASSGMCWQTYHTYNNNSYYFRTFYNGTWYAWKCIQDFGGATATLNNGWHEERLDANLYRWTQLFTVTSATERQWGNWYVSNVDNQLPAKPTGATITHVSVTAGSDDTVAFTGVNLATWAFWFARGGALSSRRFDVVAVAYGTKP